MTLPSLHQWDATRDSLHHASQILGAVRVAAIAPMPNALEYSLNWAGKGLSTGQLKVGGDLTLDFTTQVIAYLREGQTLFQLPLAGHTQISLFDGVLNALKGVGITLEPSRNKIIHEGQFAVDARIAADYAAVLNRFYTAIARFRARLLGPMTPLVLWPHHFDFSFLWFATASADEHKDPHMNFGFAPESPGFPRPYFYAYAWPMQPAMRETVLPAPARWYQDKWTGVIMDYDDVAKLDDAETVIEDTLSAVHRLVSPHFGP